MKTGGISTALEIALEENPPADEEPTLDLGLPQTKKLQRVQLSKAGRPKDARNKRTVQVAERLLSRYGDPLEYAVQIAAMPLDELQASIGCTKFEALQEKRLWTIAALPYLRQKQAVAVDLTTRKVVHLVIEDPADGGALQVPAGAEVIDLTATEVEGDG